MASQPLPHQCQIPCSKTHSELNTICSIHFQPGPMDSVECTKIQLTTEMFGTLTLLQLNMPMLYLWTLCRRQFWSSFLETPAQPHSSSGLCKITHLQTTFFITCSNGTCRSYCSRRRYFTNPLWVSAVFADVCMIFCIVLHEDCLVYSNDPDWPWTGLTE